VLLWFFGGAFAIVWNVFHDPALDHRLVLLGAILPDVVDAPFGGARWAHSLTVPVVALLLVMVATRGRRRLRRQLLALPIGLFLHLVLDGAWSNTDVFWWPVSGWSPAGDGLPSFDRPVSIVIVQELIGLAALVWAYRRFGLADHARRRTLWRTGRLDRALVAGPPPATC
jgi:hypothetical protein